MKRAVYLLLGTFLLAYVVPFASLVVSYGLGGLAASGYDPAFPGQTPGYCHTLFGLADHLFWVYSVGIGPARCYVHYVDGDPYGLWMRHGVIAHYTVADFAYALKVNWVTFLTWLFALVTGDFAWRRLLGPGADWRRRVNSLWGIGFLVEFAWVTVVVWRVTSGRNLGAWSHAVVVGVPLILLMQGALLGAFAWHKGNAEDSAVPNWLRNLGLSTAVLALLVGVLWLILVPSPR